MGENRKAYKVLAGKSEGKRTLRRPRCRCENGIRAYVGEIGWVGGMEWSQLAQDRGWWWAVVNAVMNPQVLAPQS
jgi:hypothetical protein